MTDEREVISRTLESFNEPPREEVVEMLSRSFLKPPVQTETGGLAPILKKFGHITPAEFSVIQKAALDMGTPSSLDGLSFKDWGPVLQELTALTLINWLGKVSDTSLNNQLNVNLLALYDFVTELKSK